LAGGSELEEEEEAEAEDERLDLEEEDELIEVVDFEAMARG